MQNVLEASCPRVLVAVVGTGSGTQAEHEAAAEAGRLIARRGWVLVTGGMGGVMRHAGRGAREEGGLVVGILPGPDRGGANEFVDIPIVTNMGHARNVILAHTAEAVVSVGGGHGTISEIAVALKLGKPVACVGPPLEMAGAVVCRTPEEAVEHVAKRLAAR